MNGFGREGKHNSLDLCVLYVLDMLNVWIYVCRVGLNKSLGVSGDVGKLHWLKLQEKYMHSRTSYPMWMGCVLWEVCE
jgi:hypothetical protein